MRALLVGALLVVMGCGAAAPPAPSLGPASPAGSPSASAAAAPTAAAASATAPSASGTAGPTAAAATATVPPSQTPGPAVTPATPSVGVSPTTQSRQPLRVAEFGFTESKVGNVYYGIIVQNPNATWVNYGAPLRISFFDRNGSKISTVTGGLTSVQPGQTTGIGAYSPSSTGAKSMKVELIEGDWAEMDPSPYALSVSDVVTRTKGGVMTTTGIITSTFPQRVDFVTIAVIYRDDKGKISGGANDLVSIPAQGRMPFEIRALEPLPSRTTEVYFSY
jgi:hypothetical protein